MAFQQLEQLPGDGPLQATSNIPGALALGSTPGGVGAGLRIVPKPPRQDPPEATRIGQRAECLAVTRNDLLTIC